MLLELPIGLCGSCTNKTEHVQWPYTQASVVTFIHIRLISLTAYMLVLCLHDSGCDMNKMIIIIVNNVSVL